MNTKRITGVIFLLLAIIPLHFGFLKAENYGNITGLIGLLGTLFLVFVGYGLFDSSFSNTTSHDEQH